MHHLVVAALQQERKHGRTNQEPKWVRRGVEACMHQGEKNRSETPPQVAIANSRLGAGRHMTRM